MDILTRLLIMLAAGLVAKHAVTRFGKALARGRKPRIPKLCAFAAAGTVAAGFQIGLEALGVHDIIAAALFGMMWGVIVGLMLPFSKPVEQRV